MGGLPPKKFKEGKRKKGEKKGREEKDTLRFLPGLMLMDTAMAGDLHTKLCHSFLVDFVFFVMN